MAQTSTQKCLRPERAAVLECYFQKLQLTIQKLFKYFFRTSVVSKYFQKPGMLKT